MMLITVVPSIAIAARVSPRLSMRCTVKPAELITKVIVP